jgi:hypothetical protein
MVTVICYVVIIGELILSDEHILSEGQRVFRPIPKPYGSHSIFPRYIAGLILTLLFVAYATGLGKAPKWATM